MTCQVNHQNHVSFFHHFSIFQLFQNVKKVRFKTNHFNPVQIPPGAQGDSTHFPLTYPCPVNLAPFRYILYFIYLVYCFIIYVCRTLERIQLCNFHTIPHSARCTTEEGLGQGQEVGRNLGRLATITRWSSSLASLSSRPAIATCSASSAPTSSRSGSSAANSRGPLRASFCHF